MASVDFAAQSHRFIKLMFTASPNVGKTTKFMRASVQNTNGDNWPTSAYLWPFPSALRFPVSKKPADYDRVAFSGALKTWWGRYVCVENENHVVANRPVADLWETLLVVQVDQSRVAFQSWISGRWLCAEPDGRVVCNRYKRDTWETFQLSPGSVPDTYGFFNEAHGRHLCADERGRLRCDRLTMQDWEHFAFENTPLSTVQYVCEVQGIPAKATVSGMYP